MWKKIAPLLVILSAALNVAFIGSWAAHAVAAGRDDSADRCTGPTGGHQRIWCPLHRQLGVNQEQWKQIEPKLVEFHKAAGAVCQEVGRKRAELIDLVAAPQADHQAITAKREEILAGQGRMQSLVIGQLLAEKQVLTAAQQEELFKLLRQQGVCQGQRPLMMGLGGPAGAGSASHPCQ
jgi:Spy/CpxP family protein refolding chaperone